MFLGMLLSFLLVFSVAATGLWYHIEWLHTTAIHTTVHETEHLLFTGLASYGVARLKNDIHSRLTTEDTVVVDVPSWPITTRVNDSHYSGQLLFSRQDETLYQVIVTLYKGDRVIKTARMIRSLLKLTSNTKYIVNARQP